jgi:arsenate reductase (thioredoxin)
VKKQNVLFISTRNSCRSQIAEAYLNTFAPDRFYAKSAGLEPGIIDPFAVQVMKEDGIDMSLAVSKSVHLLKGSGKMYDYVVRTCAKEVHEDIPVFPGANDRICWHIAGNGYSGLSSAQKLVVTRRIRDEIRANIIQFISQYGK